MITHVSQEEIDISVRNLDEVYRQTYPLTVHQGQAHEYLGMRLDFPAPRKVQIIMDDYVNWLLQKAPEEVDGEATTSADTYLFKVNPEAKKLSEEKSVIFHHLVTKTLFLSKRARQDNKLAVGFLCYRVKERDVNDWKKLRRLL